MMMDKMMGFDDDAWKVKKMEVDLIRRELNSGQVNIQSTWPVTPVELKKISVLRLPCHAMHPWDACLQKENKK